MNKDSIPIYLALVISVGFLGTVWVMIFHAVPEQSRDLVNIMLGVLGTAFASTVNYFFGSSAGSAKKTEIMAKEPIKTNGA